MKIASEIGNLISGLLAPKTSQQVAPAERIRPDRRSADGRSDLGRRTGTGAFTGGDRVTLSSASLALSQSTEQPMAGGETAAATSHPAKWLALPSATEAAYGQTDEGTSDAVAGQARRSLPAETPATRDRVRATYGSKSLRDADTTINLRA